MDSNDRTLGYVDTTLTKLTNKAFSGLKLKKYL